MAQAPLDGKSIEDLLLEQRKLVKRCMEDAQRCLAFNEALSKKISDQAPHAETSKKEKEKEMETRMEKTATARSDDKKAIDLNEPLIKHGASTQGDDMASTKPAAMVGGMNQRERLMAALRAPVYNVEDFYKTTGFAQAVARNDIFVYAILGVIALNTCWMAVETDYNKAVVLSEAPWGFIVVDNIFTLIFMFEISTRFSAFEAKKNALKDNWFVFDAFLVGLMVWETYIVVGIYWLLGGGPASGLKKLTVFRLFRLLRLTRVTRLARVLRAIPELMVLAKAMIMALRSVGATLTLLLLVIYIFSIMFTQMLGEEDIGKGYFENIPQTFNTLLMMGVFTEQREFITHMLDGGFTYYILMMFYLLVGSYTVLNMLIGVICEVISDVANREREDIMIHDLRYRIGKISKFFKQEDEHGLCVDHIVTRAQFDELMKEDAAAKALHEVGVDVVALVDLTDFIFPESGEIELSKFMQMILQFRGTNTATVKDVVDMRKYVANRLEKLEEHLIHVSEKQEMAEIRHQSSSV